MPIRVSLRLVAVILSLLAPAATAAQEVLRIATQAGGTVAWELALIRDRGLDRAHGIALEITDLAGAPAAQVAFLGGAADVIVADWLWAARQRAEGRDILAFPWSRAVGALMVPADSPARRLADLRGRRIGIAGGPTDKSWLILRAHAQAAHGFDLAAETEQIFAAPPLILQAGLTGEVDAALNYWQFGARAQAAGMRPLVTVDEAAAALGLDPQVPLLVWVVPGALLRDRPAAVAGLLRASREAKAILATDDAAWDALRPRMDAADDATFAALVAGFRAGIPAPGQVDRSAAARLLALMADLGGPDLVGAVTDLPAGLFPDLPD